MSIPSHHGAEPAIRTDIQGLRALAMVSVAMFHAEIPFFAGGYVGVDVFFVISGYLITGMLAREVERHGRIDLADFYARRIRRLLPAALLVFFFIALATYFLLSPLEQREIVPPLLASALYVSNFLFAAQAADYLAGDLHANPLLHTWSLSVEEQFYLAWPLLLVLAARAGTAATIRGRLVVVMTVVFLGSFALSILLTAANQPLAFFASPARAWEFSAGGLVYMAGGRLSSFPDRARNSLVAAGMGMIVASILLFDGATRFPGSVALLPVAGAALVIAAGAGSIAGFSRTFNHPAWQILGNLSYSWYLWHWPVLVIPTVLYGPLGLAERLLCVAVSLAMAALTYYAVESRIRFSPSLARAPLRALALGAFLTMVGIGNAATLRELAKNALVSPSQMDLMAVRDELPIVYRDGCHLPFEGKRSPECVYGHASARRTIVLFGDSHAAQWFPALERIARSGRWRLVSLTKSACPSVAIELRNAALGSAYEECSEWRSSGLERIAAEKPALVVLANASIYVDDPRQDIDVAAWQAGLERTVRAVRDSGAAVVVMHDTPRPDFDMPACLSRAAWRNSGDSCDFERDASSGPDILESERAAVRRIDRVFLVDPSEMLCSGSRCLAEIGGRMAYRDTNHLTAEVSRLLAPALHSRISIALPDLMLSQWRMHATLPWHWQAAIADPGARLARQAGRGWPPPPEDVGRPSH